MTGVFSIVVASFDLLDPAGKLIGRDAFDVLNLSAEVSETLGFSPIKCGGQGFTGLRKKVSLDFLDSVHLLVLVHGNPFRSTLSKSF